jgi:hypothetical protein
MTDYLLGSKRSESANRQGRELVGDFLFELAERMVRAGLDEGQEFTVLSFLAVAFREGDATIGNPSRRRDRAIALYFRSMGARRPGQYDADVKKLGRSFNVSPATVARAIKKHRRLIGQWEELETYYDSLRTNLRAEAALK